MRAFVVAMECEAECVRPQLRPDDRLFVSGIGKVNAAAATQRAIDAGATEVLNFGVAGGFGEGMRVTDVYEIARAVEYDFDLSEVDGTEVGVHDGRATPYFVLQTTGRFPARTLGTGDHFTRSEADFPRLRRLGVEIRDMEGAAIAHVCETNGVPCRSLKCLTNIVGSTATDQYHENLERSLACLKNALISWM